MILVHNPSEIEGDIKKIQQENQNNTANKHGNWPEDPKEQREREVERPQPQRPEVASPVHRPAHVLRRQMQSPATPIGISTAVLFQRHVDEDAGMAVVPYRLHVEQECYQEAH